MSDDADDAYWLEEKERAEALERVRLRLASAERVRMFVYCLNCGSKVHQAFCDEDCRDDWEHRLAVHKLTHAS